MPRPRTDGFFMPAEWQPHKRCWMAWPVRPDVWGEGLEEARRAYADVARAITQFEPVTMVANPDTVADVSLYCGSGVGCLSLGHDDSWLRDTGPTFVVDGKGAIAGVDWQFNAWGEKYQPYDQDAALGAEILSYTEVPRYEAPLVLEGGSIHVDGEGTCLVTEQCLLNPNRNPNLDRNQIEELLGDFLGVEKVIWLGEGLQDDETDGHVDNLACFYAPGKVLALSAKSEKDANYKALEDNIDRLSKAKDAKGRSLEIVEVRQPKARYGENGNRLALSYVNFYIANGGVIVPSFEDARDHDAFEIIEKCFPDRKVVQIDALPILAGGGGIHCITQQQPDPAAFLGQPEE